MDYTIYPTLDEALYLHERLLQQFGGTQGVRDLGLLESALHRPRSGYYETLAQQAAALLQSLALNHAFVDGNKRMAFALCAVFLRLNGYRLVVKANVTERFLIKQVIQAKKSLPEIAACIEKRMRAV